MPSSILAPDRMSPSELDAYLARGWRPLGQRIYSADFIQLELGRIFSVIPTRLPLNDHVFSKRQRKLLRRNGRVFRIEIRPARIDEEKLRVNDQYLLEHPTKSLQELDFHVAFEGRRIFNTMECAVYHEDELVAFSFFDQGERGVYSKAGIYLPAYRAHSLGTYTLLLELEWSKQNGMEYYYPGYISPDTPLFDYKTKLGDVEFWYLRQRRWIPYRDFVAVKHGPLRVLLDRLDALRAGLEDLDYRVPLYQYVFFEMQMMQKGRDRLLEQPFFLLLHCPAPQRCRIATYHPDLDAYECWDCDFNRMITFFEQPAQEYDLFRYVLELRKLVLRTSTVEEFLLRRRDLLPDPDRQRSRPREV